MSAPLSSISVMPLTDETRKALLAAGVKPIRLRRLTEHAGRSLLALKTHLDDDSNYEPDCYKKAYGQLPRQCPGCVFSPKCWSADPAYLRALKAGAVQPPVGIPPDIVAETIAKVENRAVPAPPPTRIQAKPPAPPPRPKRRTPPPPPRPSKK